MRAKVNLKRVYSFLFEQNETQTRSAIQQNDEFRRSTIFAGKTIF